MSYKINRADRRPSQSVHVFFFYSQTFQGLSEHEQENEESVNCGFPNKFCIPSMYCNFILLHARICPISLPQI